MAEEKIIGIDLGTTNSVVAVMDGNVVKVIPNQDGNPTHAERRRVHRQGRPAGRRAGQAAGRDQREAHRLLDQAVHGPAAQRGRERGEDRPVQARRRAERPREGGHRRQAVFAAGNLGDDPAQAQGGGRSVPRPHRPQGGHHRARVLQRRAAAGDHRRGGRRRLRHRVRDPRQGRQGRQAADAHHQRADRRRARVRAGQEEGREDRRVRPSAAAPSTSASSTSARTACSR